MKLKQQGRLVALALVLLVAAVFASATTATHLIHLKSGSINTKQVPSYVTTGVHTRTATRKQFFIKLHVCF